MWLYRHLELPAFCTTGWRHRTGRPAIGAVSNDTTPIISPAVELGPGKDPQTGIVPASLFLAVAPLARMAIGAWRFRSISIIDFTMEARALAPSAGKNEQGPTATLAFLASWQSRICKLQNLKEGRETESLSLRQFISNQVQRTYLIHVALPRVGAFWRSLFLLTSWQNIWRLLSTALHRVTLDAAPTPRCSDQ